MNLVMISIFLLATLAFQPTLIYGTKGLISTINRKNGNGKKHSALLSSAKLKLSLENGGDVLVRSSRGVGDPKEPIAPPAVSESGAISANAPLSTVVSPLTSTVGTSGTGGKRGKNNNRKSNKNISTENVSSSNGGRKHLDKKYTAASNQEQQQQLLHHLNQHQYLQQPQHHHERQHQRGIDNNKNKQRQFLKSQQNHNKRSGIKAKTATGTATGTATDDEKNSNSEKVTLSTCRYAKSPWSDCDSKTNMRTRTLSLKKGEENCLPTRTMQKKCKKQCRYDKGSWSDCNNGQMTRQDKLKSTGNIVTDATCEAVRSINKKCNPNGAGTGKQHRHQLGTANKNSSSKERKNKDKASRRATLPPKAA